MTGATALLEPAAGCAGGGPEGVSQSLAEALNAADLGAATACFARDASFVTPDATAIRGRTDIRAVLAQLIAMRPHVQIHMQSVLAAGPTALVTEHWSIRFRSGTGPFRQNVSACFVLRHIEDAWKLAIAAPWRWPGQPHQIARLGSAVGNSV